MKERDKMLSAIIHEEVDGGRSLVNLAKFLGIPYKKAHYLKCKYKPSYDDSKVLNFAELQHLKDVAKDVLDKVNAKVDALRQAYERHEVITYAFHMPISTAEQKEYKAIAELVKKDEYLPIGYRSNGDERVVANKAMYAYAEQSREQYNKELWTEQNLEYMRANYKEKTSRQIAKYLGLSQYMVLKKIKELGLS